MESEIFYNKPNSEIEKYIIIRRKFKLINIAYIIRKNNENKGI